MPEAGPFTNGADGDPRAFRSARLLRMGRQRAFAIGLSTALFVVVMAIALPHGYHGYDPTWFFIVEGCIVLICVLLNPDLYVYLLRTVWWLLGFVLGEIRGAFSGTANGSDPGIVARERKLPPERRAYLVISWQLIFALLLPSIVVNLFAVGRLVNATGGLTASPYTGYAFTMVVLGIVMAVETRTMVIVLVAGVVYFSLLSYTNVLGKPRPEVALEADKLRGQYWVVTGVTLVITWFVTWVARPSRADRPTVTTAGADEAGSATLEIIRARYGTDLRSFDVALVLAAQVSEGQLDSIANNDLAGDPQPGASKHLDLSYRIGRIERSKRYHEGDRILLP